MSWSHGVLWSEMEFVEGMRSLFPSLYHVTPVGNWFRVPLMFLVIRCPSKAPSDRGAHSQRLTQPSPLISSFLQESSPWKVAALQEDIPGGLITALTPALLRLWSKHLLFHLISNKWEAWVGGRESSTPVKYLLQCNVFYFGSGMEPWGTFSRGLHKPPLFTGWLFEEGGECGFKSVPLISANNRIIFNSYSRLPPPMAWCWELWIFHVITKSLYKREPFKYIFKNWFQIHQALK